MSRTGEACPAQGNDLKEKAGRYRTTGVPYPRLFQSGTAVPPITLDTTLIPSGDDVAPSLMISRSYQRTTNALPNWERAMQIIPLRNLTVRIPATLIEVVQRTAEHHGMTVSELVRSALQEAVALDPAVRRHTETTFEIAKTRAVLLRFLDTQLDAPQVEQLLALAEEDAQVYAHKRQGEKDG
jgi:hypothetical protein